jgi:hypothetical protein
LTEKGVGRLRKDGGGETSSDTATEGDGSLLASREVRLLLGRELLVNRFVRQLVDEELSDGVCGCVGSVNIGERGNRARNGEKRR